MTTTTQDWIGLANELGPAFAERAAEHDQDDSFVHKNYEELEARGVFAAGVPRELGGGDASLQDLCDLLRTLAHYCSSTALALSMHTHLVAVPAWRYRNERAPVNALLERVAKEQIVLVSTGGSDWLDGSGTAEKVEGGYRVSGRKIFCSGVPAGTTLMTTAVYDDPNEGRTVLHLPVALSDEGAKMLDTWHTLGMRATGSNDVTLENVFVPEAAVGVRRPAGQWHHVMHIVAMIALPLIYSVYVGVAEAARDIALRLAAKKREDTGVQLLAGELENELTGARVALESMIDEGSRSQPGPETTNRVMMRRTLAGRGAVRTVERALELGGGAAFYRGAGLERLFRDVQGARFHPMQEMPQRQYAGRMAFGLPID
jgi:alkylation response protein AidB-like acyl-CoA dehydrogenase